MITWQYVAGFFDGDGCVNLYRHKGKWKKAPLVSMDQAREPSMVLHKISRFLKREGIECAIYIRRKPPANGTALAYYSLRITKISECEKFLNAAIPFLVVKKKQAETALRLMSGRMSRSPEECLVRCKRALPEYIGGFSMKKVTRKFKVDSTSFKRYLISNGYHVRTAAEANDLRYGRNGA